VMPMWVLYRQSCNQCHEELQLQQCHPHNHQWEHSDKMAIPGVTPTKTLMSLDEYDDQMNTGALVGLGGDAEARYRSSLSGQMAPIYGKGGYQYATLNPYGQTYSFNVNDYTTSPGMPVDQTSLTNQSDGGSSFNPAQTLSGTFKTAQSLAQQPAVNTTTYGPITGMVQDYIGDANIDVPFVGNVNVPNAVVNTVLDTVGDFGVPGLGILSTIANPTQVETSWGTPFNTGGGGLIGVVGQASLNNLENIYGEVQAGTPGYSFAAPGEIADVKTPLATSPGLFGYGTVVSGATDLAMQQNPFLDANNDGRLSPDEINSFKAGQGQGFQAYQENEAYKNAVTDTLMGLQGSTGVTQKFDSQGNPAGTSFASGSLIQDNTGKVIGAVPPGMTRAEFADALEANQKASTAKTDISENVTTSGDITTQSIVDAIVSGMDRAAANPNVPGTFEVASSGNITSDASSSDSGMSSSESAASGGYAETVSGGGEFGGTSGPATSAESYNDKDGTSSSNDGGSSGGGGCVIATHGVMTGGFTLMEKAKAELWCQKTYHGKWYGEAFRRGYRAAGQRCIDQGKAREHYQEFKDFVAYGRGVKKGWGLAFKYYMRTIQFFVTGLFIKGD
jgi:hypothetical protein